MHKNSYQTPSLLVVVGMPGSGKTTYLQKLLAEGRVDSVYDDYQKDTPEEDRSNPRRSPNFAAVCADLSHGRRVAINDIRYCSAPELERLCTTMQEKFPDLKIEQVFFENNPEACRHNVRLRNRPADRLAIELQKIDLIAPQYNPPTYGVLPVIRGTIA
ncbi:MAG TPA: AAA family ATPase [Candidatus Saccharimonadales bacterium]|nr:AAA family ATPase [Candidatus Saccharimonadales bacterium]